MNNQSKPLKKGKGSFFLALCLVVLTAAGYFSFDIFSSWLYSRGESLQQSAPKTTKGLTGEHVTGFSGKNSKVKTAAADTTTQGEVLGAVKAVEDNITEDSLVFRLQVFFLEAIEAASARFDTDLEVGNDTVIGNDLSVGNDAEVTNNLTVGGELILADANVSNNAFIGNLLEVISSAVIGGDLTAGGDLAVGGIIVGDSDLEIGGAITGDGDLDIGGSITSGGDLEVGGDATIDGDLTVGGEIIASNIIYSITAGDGISVSGSQDVTITNSDRGSSQFIFKNFVFDSDTISATLNNDTLTFDSGTGIIFSTSGKTVTISADGNVLNTSGWTDDGTVVRLLTSSDNVGIGTTTSGYKLRVEGTGYFSGATTMAGGLTVQSGLNNSSGGITNAGSITGATGFTSSGTITFSNLSTGVLHSNVNGVISSSAINLAGGALEITGTLPVVNGGTGLNTVSSGDLLYGSASNVLSRLSAGGDGEVLTLSGGLPNWASIAGIGGLCPNCLIDNPGGDQTLTATSSSAVGLIIRQPSGGSVDIFRVESNDGATAFFTVDSSGNVVLGDNTTSGIFTVSPDGTDPISIDPTAQGAGQFTGTITSEDLTANRTWTFPDVSGVVCMASGNCTGTSASVGGSGSTNYLAKWSDTYALDTSVLYDNGTNVGLGTTNPLSLLHVAGTFRATGNTILGGDLSLAGHATISGTLTTDQTVDFNSTLGVSGATTLGSTLDVTGLATFGGNVGIGTNAPTSTLEIGSGQIRVPDGTAGSPSYSFSNNSNLGFYRLSTSKIGVSAGGTGRVSFNTLGQEFYSTYYLGWDAGALGTSVDTSLYRDAAGTLALRRTTGATSATEYRIYNTWTDASNNEFASLGYINNSNVFTIQTEANGTGSVRDIALLGGNVGIGTTAPIEKLHISNDSDADILLQEASDTTSFSSVFGYKSRGTVASPTIVSSGDGALSFIGRGYDGSAFRNLAEFRVEVDETPGANDMPGRLTFYTTPDGATASQERMRIDNQGNVGIGSTSPTSKLDVAGGITLDDGTVNTPSLRFRTNSNAGFYENPLGGGFVVYASGNQDRYWFTSNALQSSNSTSFYLQRAAGSSTDPVYAFYSDEDTGVARAAANELSLVTGGGEQVRIDDTGNVGIGTTDPNTKLHVVSSNLNAARVSATNSSGGTTANLSGLIANVTTNPGSTTTRAYGVQSSIGESGGTVTHGFGAYTSIAPFSGTISNAYGFYADSDSLGGTMTNYAGVFIEANSFATNNTYLAIASSESIPSGNYAIYNASTYRNYFAGNVGIGTSNPGALLSISGSTPAVHINGESSTPAILRFQDSGVDQWGFLSDHVSAGDFGLYDYDAATYRMTWLDNGAVGIGTTNPSDILHLGVTGGIRITNSELANVTDASGVLYFDENYYSVGEAGYPHFTGNGGGLAFKNEDGWGALVSTANMQFLDMDLNSLYVANNVGVGTTAAGSVSLHAYGTSEILRLQDSNAAGNPYLSFYQAGTRRAYIQLNDSLNDLRLNSEYGDISFYSSGTERFEIDSTGIFRLFNDSVYSFVPDTASDHIRFGQTSGDDYIAFDLDQVGMYTFGNATTFYAQTGQFQVAGSTTNAPGSRLESHVASGEIIINSRLSRDNASAGNRYFLQMWRGPNVTQDNEFLFRDDGHAFADQSWNGGGADVAEMYHFNQKVEPGELVSIPVSASSNPGKTLTKSSGKPYDGMVVGVVSTDPGLVAGFGDAEIENTTGSDLARKPVALVGRVPVRVNLENGPIQAGDYLTASSVPGEAMKATQAGKIIGQALEDYDGSQAKSPGVQIVESDFQKKKGTNVAGIPALQSGQAKIMVYIYTGWYDPSSQVDLAQDPEIHQFSASAFISKLGVDSLTIKGVPLSEYIAQIVGVSVPQAAPNTASGSAVVQSATSSAQLTQQQLQQVDERVALGIAELTQSISFADQVATFIREVVFTAQTKFLAAVEFTERTLFSGEVVFSKENAGTVTISPGVTKIKVSFDRTFSTEPNVYLTSKGSYQGALIVSEIGREYFVLELSQENLNDIEVQWLAVIADKTNVERVEVLETTAGGVDATQVLGETSSSEDQSESEDNGQEAINEVDETEDIQPTSESSNSAQVSPQQESSASAQQN